MTRPAQVVALLTDNNSDALPFPRFVDLGQGGELQIARSIPAGERGKLFGSAYPQYV